MADKFKVFVFLLLLATESKAQNELVIPERNIKIMRFIIDQNNLTRWLVESDMSKYFANLYPLLNQKINRIHFELVTQTEMMHKMQNQLSNLLPIRVEVEEVTVDSGTIEFNGGRNPHLLRKIWVFNAKTTRFLTVNYRMEGNNFCTVSVSGMIGYRHVWDGSQSDWGRKGEVGGPLVVVMLRVKSSATPMHPPSFKFTFNTTAPSYNFVSSSELVLSDGVQSVSFPANNAQNYPSDSFFNALIAPPDGRSFRLMLKYLDISGSPPNCTGDSLYIGFLEEDPSYVKFKNADMIFNRCGRLGNVSEYVGTSTVAIITFFSSARTDLGKGFRLEAEKI